MAQLGSAPALGANFWRRWASASVGNAGFLRQSRRPASVGSDAVLAQFEIALALADSAYSFRETERSALNQSARIHGVATQEAAIR